MTENQDTCAIRNPAPHRPALRKIKRTSFQVRDRASRAQFGDGMQYTRCAVFSRSIRKGRGCKNSDRFWPLREPQLTNNLSSASGERHRRSALLHRRDRRRTSLRRDLRWRKNSRRRSTLLRQEQRLGHRSSHDWNQVPSKGISLTDSRLRMPPKLKAGTGVLLYGSPLPRHEFGTNDSIPADSRKNWLPFNSLKFKNNLVAGK